VSKDAWLHQVVRTCARAHLKHVRDSGDFPSERALETCFMSNPPNPNADKKPGDRPNDKQTQQQGQSDKTAQQGGSVPSTPPPAADSANETKS